MNGEEQPEIQASPANPPPNTDMVSARFIFWPTMLLSIAFNLFFLFQIHGAWVTTSSLAQQEKDVTQRLKQLQGEVVTARQMLALLDGIAKDLLALGATDPEVRALVDKHKIRRIGTRILVGERTRDPVKDHLVNQHLPEPVGRRSSPPPPPPTAA